MSSQTQPHPAHVASATAGTSTRAPPQPRGLLLEPRQAASGVAAVVTTVQIGWPAAIRSPGCGTSRTPRSSQRSLSPIVTSSVANTTALPAARERAASMRGSSPAQPRRCASNTSIPYAASIASSDAVGRGLTSSVHARSPSQMKSTPNRPRSANAPARREQIARA